MKFGIVGLGSMGKRRVRDLTGLGHTVLGFDIREDRQTQAAHMFGIRTVGTFDQLSCAGLDGVVISTPPDRHVQYYELCYQRGLAYFSEANIFAPPAQWFSERERTSGVRGFPSATWRFHPLVRELAHRLQEAGPAHINSFSHQYAGFLPDWHPWEPYTDFYAGRRTTSAAREMVPFELEIFADALGPVARVQALKARARRWEADFDDTYLMLLQFESGVIGTLSVELHHVLPARLTRVSLAEQELTLDMNAPALTIFDKARDCARTIRPQPLQQNWGFSFEHVYREEIRRFVAALAGEPYPKSWADDRHLSDVLYAAELSSATGQAVVVRDVASAYDGMSWVNG
jgi:predicted dehydrogenase